MIVKRSIFVFLAVLLAAAVLVAPVFGDQGSAQNAIFQAKKSIKECYDAASQAESAGANIDSLMVTLNDAAGLLSKAELSYASGDYGSAYNYATQSQSKLGSFIGSAAALTAGAQVEGQQNMFVTVMLAAFSGVVLCAGIVAWVVLGRRERRGYFGSSTI